MSAWRSRSDPTRIVFCERVELSEEQIEDQDTARLITRIQANGREEFARLYDRYFDRIYGYLRVVFNDAAEAEDGAQQVFMQVMEALPGYERRPKLPFRAWLFVIARNYAIAELREQNRLEPMELEEINRRRADLTSDGPEPPVLDWISDGDLMLFVERLPLAQRQVLLLRFSFDMPNSEIARILELSENHVRVLQHRALSFLRKRLVAVGREPQHGLRAGMARVPDKARVLRERRFALVA